MKLFCSVCESFFPEGSAWITDPAVRAADATAVVCHPSCYAYATGQIPVEIRDQEIAAGRELPDLRRGKQNAPSFAGLAIHGNKAPLAEPPGKVRMTHTVVHGPWSALKALAPRRRGANGEPPVQPSDVVTIVIGRRLKPAELIPGVTEVDSDYAVYPD